MRLDFSNEHVLTVVAHPDDAEYLCAGTLARAKADGAAIGVCVLCQGDKGQPTTPIPNLADVRRAEMAANYFIRSISIDSDQTDAVVNLCDLLRANGQLGEAAQLLHTLAAKYPHHREIADLLNEAQNETRVADMTASGNTELPSEVNALYTSALLVIIFMFAMVGVVLVFVWRRRHARLLVEDEK